jgi:hypothetical protein
MEGKAAVMMRGETQTGRETGSFGQQTRRSAPAVATAAPLSEAGVARLAQTLV